MRVRLARTANITVAASGDTRYRERGRGGPIMKMPRVHRIPHVAVGTVIDEFSVAPGCYRVGEYPRPREINIHISQVMLRVNPATPIQRTQSGTGYAAHANH